MTPVLIFGLVLCGLAFAFVALAVLLPARTPEAPGLRARTIVAADRVLHDAGRDVVPWRAPELCRPDRPARPLGPARQLERR